MYNGEGGQKERLLFQGGQMASTSSSCLCVNNYSQLGPANPNFTLAIASVQRFMSSRLFAGK